MWKPCVKFFWFWHLHRSFDSPPRGATEPGRGRICSMNTCVLYTCMHDVYVFAFCMYLRDLCIHAWSCSHTYLLLVYAGKHICALVCERMIQDVCAWIFWRWLDVFNVFSNCHEYHDSRDCLYDHDFHCFGIHPYIYIYIFIIIYSCNLLQYIYMCVYLYICK